MQPRALTFARHMPFETAPRYCRSPSARKLRARRLGRATRSRRACTRPRGTRLRIVLGPVLGGVLVDRHGQRTTDATATTSFWDNSLFSLVIPQLVHALTVVAIDLPGMGWSDITPGASHDEPALRRATVDFVNTLDLDEVTLAGESMGATVSLTVSTELEDRVRRILAFNSYDYSEGVSRAKRVASIYIGGARLPAIGPVVATMENKPALRMVMRGGLFDGSKLPNHYLAELRRVGRGRGYPTHRARGLPQRGQHDRRPRTLWSRHRPRHLDLRRSRLVANPRA
jgi:pimeloyl-ACP methyl ester carboxylesterase